MVRNTLLRTLPFQGSRDRRSEFWRLIHQPLKDGDQGFSTLNLLAQPLITFQQGIERPRDLPEDRAISGDPRLQMSIRDERVRLADLRNTLF